MRTPLLRAVPLAVYRAFNGGMPVLVGLFIAARWGLQALGAYTVASSLLAVAVVIADWGSSRLLPREMARRDGDAAAVVRTATAVRIVLTLLAVAAGLLYAVAGDVDADVLPYLLVLTPVAFAAIVSTNSISARVVDGDLRGMLAAVAAGLIPLLLAAAVWRSARFGPLAVAGAYACGKWIETALLTRRRWALQRVSFAGAGKVFALLFPFGATAIMGTIYSRLPIFVLERWSTREELGIVAAATAVQNVMLLVPTAAALFLYPRITVAAAHDDRIALAATLRSYFVTSVAVYCGGMAVLWMLLGRVTGALGVPASAAPFLLLYVAAGFLSIINVMATAVLQAVGAERRAALVGMVVLSVSVVVQIVFVRAWGMRGALAGVIACETLSMLLLSISAWRLSRSAVHADGFRATAVTYGEK